MSRTVRLSRKAAQALHSKLTEILSDLSQPHLALGDFGRAMAELQSALRLPPKRVSPSKVAKAKRKLTKKEETLAIRIVVMTRAAGHCEACGHQPAFAPLQLDHFFGRRGPQSARTCWALDADCHRQKTNNVPDASHWLNAFGSHCDRLGYSSEAKRCWDRLESKDLLSQAKAVSR